MAKERPDLKPLCRAEADRDRLALGANGEEPEPGFAHVDVPLASTFMLSTKAGKKHMSSR